MVVHQCNGVDDYSDGRTSSDNSGKCRQHQHWESYQSSDHLQQHHQSEESYQSCDHLQQQHRPRESYQSPHHLQQQPAPVTVSPWGYAANYDSSLINKVLLLHLMKL
ncbi:hypothetical protein V6N13_103837 [Hibiscus sabdariffa]|uniref:Uncharacterized protein n=2 Tax=Hibiscus sabdariffa TaxID=183260 RepID=A0ABR2BSX3_9ROSI